MLKIKMSCQFQIEQKMELFYLFETAQEASSWLMRHPHNFPNLKIIILLKVSLHSGGK